MTEFVIGKLRVPYKLKRSPAAKHVRIEMTMDAMEVTAPAEAEPPVVEQALHRKRRWIVENHYDLALKYEQTHKIARFRTGAKLPYWGRLTKLTTLAADCEQPIVEYRNGLIVHHRAQSTPSEHDDLIEAALKAWLRQRLEAEAREAGKRYAKRLDVIMSALRIGQLKSSWGSCGERGAVSLDWHLVFAPKRVLHYVMAHELAHLVERNHSPQFWRTVRVAYGDFEREHDWLAQNEHLLGYKRIPIGGTGADLARYSVASRSSAALP